MESVIFLVICVVLRYSDQRYGLAMLIVPADDTDVDVVNFLGETPLHIACYEGRLEVAPGVPFFLL